MMSIRNIIVVVTSLFIFTCTVAAQEATQAPPAKVIHHVPVKAVSPASGKNMYTSYCAVCHGTDGKGGGPAASALKVPPTDLTLLSKTNGGKYPALKVTSSIRGEAAVPAHGSKEMPVWGTLFGTLSGGHQSEVQQRVVNLTNYIETMQAK
jgi:mono/diheme cytochrome c family protein